MNHDTQTTRKRKRMTTFFKGKPHAVPSICFAAKVAQVFEIGFELVAELKS